MIEGEPMRTKLSVLLGVLSLLVGTLFVAATSSSAATQVKTFATSTEGVASWYGASVSRVSTPAAHGGSYSLRVSPSGTYWGVEERWPGRFTVTGGTTYRVGAWVKAISGTTSLEVTVGWVSNSGAFLREDTVAPNTSPVATVWAEKTKTLTAPVGATRLFWRFTGTGRGTWQMDDLSLSSSGPLPATTTTGPTSTTTVPPTTTTTTVPPTTTTTTTTQPPPPPPPGSAGPVCGTSSLNGPSSPPAGAVTVPAGDNSAVDFGRAVTYWFAPGTHTLGTAQFDQIIPATGAAFIGGPGAVLDGQFKNAYAFTQHASNVTIKYLTITRFGAGGLGANNNEGVVNHDSGDGWIIAHNTLINNAGAAMMSGARQQMIGNCVKDNAQYGLNAYKADDSITDIVLDGNEFVGNNTWDWEAKIDGCGCTGAMKFWAVDGADIRNNWIHHNHGPGIWADTNDNDFLIENNVIEGNESEALFYEISYNLIFRNNTVRNNTWKQGREFAARGDQFPIGTVYMSESGGDPRWPARTSFVEIYGNQFENNWGGVIGWENADRFCNSPANTSGGYCTRFAQLSQCVQPGIASEPLYSNCRWKTQRMRVHDNTFSFDPAALGCSTVYCGHSGLLSNWGTYPTWSPYQGSKVQDAITFRQDNLWASNAYVGPWQFVAFETGRLLTLNQWRAAPYLQDNP